MRFACCCQRISTRLTAIATQSVASDVAIEAESENVIAVRGSMHLCQFNSPLQGVMKIDEGFCQQIGCFAYALQPCEYAHSFVNSVSIVIPSSPTIRHTWGSEAGAAHV